jgi:import inner membrane translocase subunit TIM9
MEEVFRRYRYLAEHIFENVTEEHLVNTYQNKTQTVNTTMMDNSEQIKNYKDFLTNYNKLSEFCFNDCIRDFTTEKIWKGEKNCSLNCAEKFLKTAQGISTRTMELQTLADQKVLTDQKSLETMEKTGVDC